MASVCEGCVLTESDAASRFTRNNEETLSFLREHAVLPRAVKCPRCDKPCTLRAERHQWECYSKVRKPKSKKRIQCNFSVSDYKGTFLDKCHIDPWKLVLFVNFWLRKWFSHRQIFDNLQLNSQTAVTWRRYCSEVAEDFVAHQPPIGGPDIFVEIAEFEFVKSKTGRGREDAAGVWVFGGIERVSEKFFAVGLMEDPRRDRATLIPLIRKHIRPGSIIVSEEWPDGMKMNDLGYRHLTTHHSTEFVVPPNPDVHTRNIERLWRDIKSFVLRSGIRREYYQQYISRYIFIKSVGNSELLLHTFFIAAGKLYPHTTGPGSCSTSSGIGRSKRWVANCKRGDLLNRDVDYLDHNGRPCAEHFSAEQFMNTQEKKQCIAIQAPKERFSTPPNEHHVRNPEAQIVHEKKIESESNEYVAMESVCNKEEVTKSSLEPLHIKEEIEFEESVTIKEEPIELEPEPDLSCIKEETQDYFSSEVVVKEESRQDCFTSNFMDFYVAMC
ncbi:uncharacterized protein LOC135205735 [Macrobrachium nipponense]|uniref:uncharacterized protein LOC135205735 n=1 Tax=Macrobrachium nipponense TaxID=159736 RepID=UPI0030C7FFEC